MRFYDIHMHAGSESELTDLAEWLAEDPPYYAIPSATRYSEAKQLDQAIRSSDHLRSHLFPSAGLHPWNAELGISELKQMEPFILNGPWIGEIGLDRPWCDIPLNMQLPIFRSQLELGAKHRRPVLIHSKGYEEEVYWEIQAYPYPVIIHWYSCQDTDLLTRFIELGCYFTLGPDNGYSKDTEALWRLCPTNRLLLETDGLGAILWAEGKPDSDHLPARHLLRSLKERVARLSTVRGVEEEELYQTITANSERLLGI